MDDSQRVALIQASLGGIDRLPASVPQSIDFDHFVFMDENFPPRKALTPRMQAKIPKFFGWQLKPDYDFYIWLDGNISLAKPSTLQYFLEQIKDHDIVVLRHPSRPNIRQEVRYTRKGINQQSIYMVSRYNGEQHAELYDIIEHDPDYTDDLLAIGGIFMYRNTSKVQQMMKDWWYYVTRYIVNDQISFAYVMKKNDLKIKVLDHAYDEWDFIKYERHATRDQ